MFFMFLYFLVFCVFTLFCFFVLIAGAQVFFLFLYFYTFCAFYIFYIFAFFVFLYFFVLYFCTLSFGSTVHMNFHAKSGVCSSKNGWVMSTFVLMYFFVLLYFFFVRKWLQAVKIYLHAKFRASSSKIERVMLNFVFCAVPCCAVPSLWPTYLLSCALRAS